MDLNGIVDKALSRRSFLTGLGTAAAAAALTGCADDAPAVSTSSTPSTLPADGDILNFALNLEYLEAEFYLRAATGQGLTPADTGAGTSTTGTGAGAVVGGTKVPGLSTVQQRILNEIAYDEQQHVRLLRAQLGTSAVARPAIDLTAGFTGAVTAANALTSTAPTIPAGFDPFGASGASPFDQFLVGAFVFEDVGVTAYNGAAPLISALGISNGILAAAAGLLSTEAYHAAYVRTTLTANAISQGSTAYPYAGYANRISALRAAIGGGMETALSGFSATPTTAATVGTSSTSYSTIVASGTTALAYARTTSQVLHIVYGTGGAAGVTKGGFFPNGMNGTISATTA